ncbi:MAG: hypothetical protein ACI4DV_03410 [Lachnospiraceae bacterium]
MSSRWHFFATGAAVLSVAVLVLLFFRADKLEERMSEKQIEAVSHEAFGENLSSLTVDQEKMEFDGNGIFDPMKGVKATDCDGKNITYKVAVAYVMNSDIQKKTVRYTVYTSAGEKLVAQRELELSGYKGPDIACETVDSISFEELERIASVLAGNGMLKGDDGFGNDATGGIACSYELDQQTGSAMITLSLQNLFGDVKLVKFQVAVENLPDYLMD